MKDESGVYILYANDEPVYVGSSVLMRKRVRYHNHRGKFDRAEYIPCPNNELQAKEQDLISTLKPVLNKVGAYRSSLNDPARGCGAVNMSIDWTAEDMKVLLVLRKDMEKQQGRVSWARVLRAAIRKAAAK